MPHGVEVEKTTGGPYLIQAIVGAHVRVEKNRQTDRQTETERENEAVSRDLC